jgi:putative spermidine/putrescine transport system substrate-binding protein
MTRHSFPRLLAALALAFCSGVAQAQNQITVQVWGTTWQSVMQSLAQEFEKQSGIKVVPVTQASSGEGLVRLQNMRDAPTIDVSFTTSSVAERAVTDKKLFLPLPKASMPNLAAVGIPGAVSESWVAAYYYPVSIIWRPDLVKQPITSWSELWDPRFARKLGIPSVSMYQARMLLVSATLNGGGVANVEPGFTALKALKPNVGLFYSSDAAARQALAQGEIAVLIGPPSQAKRMRDQGVPVDIVSPKPAPMMFDVMTLVNTPRAAQGARFIDFVLSRSSQDAISEKLNMAPVHKDSKPAPEVARALPKPGDAVAFDEGPINANIAAWNERFNREVAN